MSLKKKNFFERLRNKFVLYGREKITIMVVPHDHKRVKNINLSYWKFLTYFLVIVFLFSFSFMTIGRFAYYFVKEQIYFSKHDQFVTGLGSLIKDSDKLISAQDRFNSVLRDVLKSARIRSFSSFNLDSSSSQDPISIGLLKPKEESYNLSKQESEEIDEIKGLLKINSNSKEVFSKLQQLSKKMKSFEQVTRYIPSIWPLVGSGTVKRSHNGLMEIVTLPFTPVVATADGKLIDINFTSRGIKLTLLHKYEFISSYNGLYKVSSDIHKGDEIKKGTILGYVSKNKGQAILRYSIFVGNSKAIYPIDPEKFSYLGR